jgi:hypothetical protein
MKRTALTTALFAATLFAASSANATPVIVNTTLSNISSAFDSIITGVGSTVVTAQVVTGTNLYNYVDKDGNPATVTVTRPNGSAPSFYGNYSSGGISLSGSSWSINPGAIAADPIPGYNSGLTFDFSSPVNAFGFEVGDWATCCMTGTRPTTIQTTYGVPATGSGLWIAFDGGAATLPANALSASDNPGYAASRSFTNFIGAIDSSNYFSKVTFFGDGFGEVLVAGGTLRFASVPKGWSDPVSGTIRAAAMNQTSRGFQRAHWPRGIEMKATLTVTAIAIALVLGGCGTTTASRTGTGALGGAAAGAAIGSLSGDAGKGALIGGAAGAIGGAIYDSHEKEKERQSRGY